MNVVIKMILIGIVIGLGVWLAPGVWWIFNLCMSNERFADAFAMVAAFLLVWGIWWLVRRVWS